MESNPNLTATFQRLADQWYNEILPLSDSHKIAAHPCYQQIIALGAPAVPLILADLQTRGGHWFAALHAITGENPITPEIAGRINLMKNAWLQWAKHNGHLK